MESNVMAGGGAAEPKSVDAGRGLAWWTEGWALFTKNAGMWIVMGLIFMVILIVLAFIPIIGAFASCLLMPVFTASWMMAAQKLEGGGTLEAGDLFAAFKGERVTPLVIVGALFVAVVVVITIVVFVLGAGGMMGMLMGGARRSAGGLMAGIGMGLFAVLIALVLGMLASMAVWFAPGLVALRGVAPVDAMRLSFSASLKNVVPFILWAVIYFVAAIVASIPLGLGWIVLGPLLLLTLYTSYKDIFGA